MDIERLLDLPDYSQVVVFTIHHSFPAEEIQIVLYREEPETGDTPASRYRVRATRQGYRVDGVQRWDGDVSEKLWNRVWRRLRKTQVHAISSGIEGCDGTMFEVFVKDGLVHSEFGWWVEAPEGWAVFERTGRDLEGPVRAFLEEAHSIGQD